MNQKDCLALPPGAQAYKRTPVFTQDTVPAGLLRDHVTREGTWALIHVLEGVVTRESVLKGVWAKGKEDEQTCVIHKACGKKGGK